MESDQATDQAATINKKIVQLVQLMNTPRKRAELQQMIGLKHNPTFRTNYIDAAIAAGYIAQSHPENPTHPDQYYYLTEKGLKLREQLIKKQVITPH